MNYYRWFPILTWFHAQLAQKILNGIYSLWIANMEICFENPAWLNKKTISNFLLNDNFFLLNDNFSQNWQLQWKWALLLTPNKITSIETQCDFWNSLTALFCFLNTAPCTVSDICSTDWPKWTFSLKLEMFFNQVGS